MPMYPARADPTVYDKTDRCPYSEKIQKYYHYHRDHGNGPVLPVEKRGRAFAHSVGYLAHAV
jgi:hypothetical protein